jgi:hypothetical protein
MQEGLSCGQRVHVDIVICTRYGDTIVRDPELVAAVQRLDWTLNAGLLLKADMEIVAADFHRYLLECCAFVGSYTGKENWPVNECVLRQPGLPMELLLLFAPRHAGNE